MCSKFHAHWVSMYYVLNILYFICAISTAIHTHNAYSCIINYYSQATLSHALRDTMSLKYIIVTQYTLTIYHLVIK